jgi:hypothetical protein
VDQLGSDYKAAVFHFVVLRCVVVGRFTESTIGMAEEYAGSRQTRAGTADQTSPQTSKCVGHGNAWKAKELGGIVWETLLYSQGIFGRYSDSRISYRSTFACPPRSVNQLHLSCRSLWARFNLLKQDICACDTRISSQVVYETTFGHVSEQPVKWHLCTHQSDRA